MKLYRHYKNKPYKFQGVARHSETLEELVVYETLYDNPTAKLWVRPRALFESTLELNDQIVSRFAKVELKIESCENLGKPEIELVSSLGRKVFEKWDREKFETKLSSRRGVLLLLAFVDSQPVGFKLGYELDKECFYSWLGGVVPDFRGVGIAQDLLERQHKICRDKGYFKIQTKTQKQGRSMLLLNIRNGFDVVGYQASEKRGDSKVILEKVL